MKRIIQILLVFLALTFATFLPESADAQRASRISRPCSGTTITSKVETEPDGDVAIRPCSAGKVRIGDYDGNYGNTYLEIDDSTQTGTFTGMLNATIGVGSQYFSVTDLPLSKSFNFNAGSQQGKVSFGGVNRFYYSRTFTAAGTTGNQTINWALGRVNFAAGASSLVVTNGTVDQFSMVFCTIQTNDATATSCRVTDIGTGTFTIRLNAAATAETAVGFHVMN